MLKTFFLFKNKGKYQSKNKSDSLNKYLLEYLLIICDPLVIFLIFDFGFIF